MHAEFPTTEWEMIADACSPSIGRKRDALGRVFNAYRPPIEAWLRKLGTSPEHSEEIVQGFFAQSIMDRRLLETAGPGKGRLRTLLRTAVERYRIDVFRRDGARRRAESAAGAHRASEDAHAESDPAHSAAFDAEWSRVQLQMALDRSRALMLATGREREWMVFEQAVLVPAVHGTAAPSMAQIALRVGLPSAAVASNLLFQAKRRIQAMHHEVVSETVASAEDFKAETEHVASTLQRGTDERRTQGS